MHYIKEPEKTQIEEHFQKLLSEEDMDKLESIVYTSMHDGITKAFDSILDAIKRYPYADAEFIRDYITRFKDNLDKKVKSYDSKTDQTEPS